MFLWQSWLLIFFNTALAFKFSLKNSLFLATCFFEKLNIFFVFFIVNMLKTILSEVATK